MSRKKLTSQVIYSNGCTSLYVHWCCRCSNNKICHYLQIISNSSKCKLICAPRQSPDGKMSIQYRCFTKSYNKIEN